MKSFVLLIAIATQTPAAAPDFDTEVMPVFSRLGCNSAECHGGAAGRGGLHLSLFGGDPAGDYRRLVHELEGRRINHASPAASLLVSKPTLQLDHGGGQRFTLESPFALTIARWIEAGAKREIGRHLHALELAADIPPSPTIGDHFRISAWATYSDESRRKVNDLAIFSSSNEAALAVTSDGEVTLRQGGRHAVIVTFLGETATLAVTVPYSRTNKSAERTQAVPTQPPSQSWIDDPINQTLRQLNLTAAPAASDAEFLRRLYLDLLGRLPSREEQAAFDADHNSTKRQRLIETLLASDDFTQYWTHRYAKWLGMSVPNNDQVAARVFHDWLRNAVASDRGWNQIAADVIQAEGDTHQVGAAAFHRFTRDVYAETEQVAEVFMGVRLRCANCHNHPLDRWTQDDYHGLAQVFAKLERGQIVHENDYAQVIHPATAAPAVARVPGGDKLDPDQDLRAQLASWLTSPGTPHLSRAWTARIWDALFGPLLFNNPDDLRPSNPPSHPELFARLCQFTLENDFRLRPMLRLICNSEAYQRESGGQTSPHDVNRYYARYPARPLPALVLADAIADVTEIPWRTALETQETGRVIEQIDRRHLGEDLAALGWCEPSEQGCAATTNTAGRGLRAELTLMNGEVLNRRIQDPRSRLHRQWQAGTPAAKIIAEHYQVALCRPPTPTELEHWIRTTSSAATLEEQRILLEDFVWALLNCDEFIMQH